MSKLDTLLSRIKFTAKDIKSLAFDEPPAFEESAHPRVSSGPKAGQFAPKGGGAGGSSASATPSSEQIRAMPYSERTAFLENHYAARQAIVKRTIARVAGAIKIPNRASKAPNTYSVNNNAAQSVIRFRHQFGSTSTAESNLDAVRRAYTRSAQLAGGEAIVHRSSYDRPSQISVEIRLPLDPVYPTGVTPPAAAPPTREAVERNARLGVPAPQPTPAPPPEAAPAELEMDLPKLVRRERIPKGELAAKLGPKLSSKPIAEIIVDCEDEGITFSNGTYGSSDISPTVEKIKEFEKLTNGLDPISYKKHLLSDLPDVRNATMTYVMRASTLSAKAVIKTKDTVIKLNRSYNFETGTVSHDYQTMESRLGADSAKVQGGGKCAAMFTKSLDIYDNMGIKKVSVHANIDVGGFAWARYGFVPDQPSWNGIKTHVRNRMVRLEPGVQSAVKKILSSSDPKAIRQLAAIKTKHEGQPIGSYLLKNSDWYGTIDMEDNEAYSLTREYSGKRREPKK